jgi:hypothetical protein
MCEADATYPTGRISTLVLPAFGSGTAVRTGTDGTEPVVQVQVHKIEEIAEP